MNANAIKGARITLGYDVKEMAEYLGICTDSYRRKERGNVKFTDDEKVKVAKRLNMTYRQFNDWFYDGQLPDDTSVGTVRE